LFAINLAGQFDFSLAGGARHIGMGRATVSLDGLPAVFHNPAGIAGVSGYAIGINGLKRYNINGLNYFSGGGIVGNDVNGIGFRIIQKGLDGYKETNGALSYARKLSDQISIGGSLNYYHLSQLDLEKNAYYSFDIGMISQLSRDFSLGIKISNPIRQSIEGDYTLISSIRLGLLYRLSKNIYIVSEIEKSSTISPDVKFGINYKAIEKIEILIGVIPTLSEYSFGFSYDINPSLQIVGSFTYNLLFDLSPAFGLNYSSF
jgi:hypothetical protein